MSDAKDDVVLIPVPREKLEKAALDEVRQQVRFYLGPQAVKSYAESALRQMVTEALVADRVRELVKESVLGFLSQREGWLARVLRQDKRDVQVRCVACRKPLLTGQDYDCDPTVNTADGKYHTTCYQSIRAEVLAPKEG